MDGAPRRDLFSIPTNLLMSYAEIVPAEQDEPLDLRVNRHRISYTGYEEVYHGGLRNREATAHYEVNTSSEFRGFQLQNNYQGQDFHHQELLQNPREEWMQVQSTAPSHYQPGYIAYYRKLGREYLRQFGYVGTPQNWGIIRPGRSTTSGYVASSTVTSGSLQTEDERDRFPAARRVLEERRDGWQGWHSTAFNQAANDPPVQYNAPPVQFNTPEQHILPPYVRRGQLQVITAETSNNSSQIPNLGSPQHRYNLPYRREDPGQGKKNVRQMKKTLPPGHISQQGFLMRPVYDPRITLQERMGKHQRIQPITASPGYSGSIIPSHSKSQQYSSQEYHAHLAQSAQSETFSAPECKTRRKETRIQAYGSHAYTASESLPQSGHRSVITHRTSVQVSRGWWDENRILDSTDGYSSFTVHHQPTAADDLTPRDQESRAVEEQSELLPSTYVANSCTIGNTAPETHLLQGNQAASLSHGEPSAQVPMEWEGNLPCSSTYGLSSSPIGIETSSGHLPQGGHAVPLSHQGPSFQRNGESWQKMSLTHPSEEGDEVCNYVDVVGISVQQDEESVQDTRDNREENRISSTNHKNGFDLHWNSSMGQLPLSPPEAEACLQESRDSWQEMTFLTPGENKNISTPRNSPAEEPPLPESTEEDSFQESRHSWEERKRGGGTCNPVGQYLLQEVENVSTSGEIQTSSVHQEPLAIPGTSRQFQTSLSVPDDAPDDEESRTTSNRRKKMILASPAFATANVTDTESSEGEQLPILKFTYQSNGFRVQSIKRKNVKRIEKKQKTTLNVTGNSNTDTPNNFMEGKISCKDGKKITKRLLLLHSLKRKRKNKKKKYCRYFMNALEREIRLNNIACLGEAHNSNLTIRIQDQTRGYTVLESVGLLSVEVALQRLQNEPEYYFRNNRRSQSRSSKNTVKLKAQKRLGNKHTRHRREN